MDRIPITCERIHVLWRETFWVGPWGEIRGPAARASGGSETDI